MKLENAMGVVFCEAHFVRLRLRRHRLYCSWARNLGDLIQRSDLSAEEKVHAASDHYAHFKA